MIWFAFSWSIISLEYTNINNSFIFHDYFSSANYPISLKIVSFLSIYIWWYLIYFTNYTKSKLDLRVSIIKIRLYLVGYTIIIDRYIFDRSSCTHRAVPFPLFFFLFSSLLLSLSFLVSAPRQKGQGVCYTRRNEHNGGQRKGGQRRESPFAPLVEDVAQLIRVGWNLIKLT